MVILQVFWRYNLYNLKWGTIDEANVSEVYSDTTKLWHVRLWHVKEQSQMKHGLLRSTNTCKHEFYEHCVIGKKIEVKFGTTCHDIREIIDYVYSDIWGPTKIASIDGSHYFVSFIDDFSKCVWLYTMRAKDEVLDIFVKWRNLWRLKLAEKIKVLDFDNEGKYTSDPFLQVY